jgi:tetratricopeptide (TPR) repeat protein
VFRTLRSALLIALTTGMLTVPAIQAQTERPLFDDPPKKDGGWQGLANLLEALTPGVDTSIPLSASDITNRLASMLDSGQAQQALEIIERRQAQLEERNAMGADVQLLFLRGRALAAVGRTDEAIAAYKEMTTQYPELPEPWNNLAALYVQQGQLDMAKDALTMALIANPNYGVAKANLGDVQLRLAQRSFQEAAAQGVSGAARKASQAEAVIENKGTPRP